ncbi:MAG: hypothetical protein R6W94_13285 [Spirochaetia bacterium]
MRSIQTDHIFRGAVDLYRYVMFWVLVIFGIGAVVRAGLWVFVEKMSAIEVTWSNLFRGPGQVFMLVAGIVTGGYVIHYYIRQGVIRRSFLVSGVLAGLAVAVSLQVIGMLVYGLAVLLEPLVPIAVHRSGVPLLGITVDLLVTTALYLMGWIVGFAFSRFSLPGGMLATVLGIAVLGSLTSLWGENVTISVTGFTMPPVDGLSIPMSIFVTVGLLTAQLVSLYFLVRNAPLRVK